MSINQFTIYCVQISRVLFYLAKFILIYGFAVVMISLWLFPEPNGSYNLGGDLYLLTWDEGINTVVYADENDMRRNECYGGNRIIPQDEDCNIKIKYIDFNDNWIILKALIVDTNYYIYYIIDMSFINIYEDNKQLNILDYIYSTRDSIEFNTKVNENNINLILRKRF